MNNLTKRIITSAILITAFLLTFFYLPPFIFSIILTTALLYILIFEWPQLCTHYYIYALTPAYPIAPFLLLIYMNCAHRTQLFALIALVAIFDAASYVAGKSIGNHTIAPRISPGKTWEGFLGGYIVTLTGYSVWFAPSHLPWLHAALFILGLCIFALCGDLFESMLKRRAGIKDSGSLLPGHGGILDRVDGLLFAVIFLLATKIF